MTVHNHGPEEGKGLACKEGYVNGKLKGECIAPLKPLEFQALAFTNYLDCDGDLRVDLEEETCSVYLSRKDVEALRDHLNLLLEGSKPAPKKGEPGYVLTREEAADFARRWDARVEGNLG